jgi:hypothetical protein
MESQITYLGWPPTLLLLVSISQVARIIGISYYTWLPPFLKVYNSVVFVFPQAGQPLPLSNSLPFKETPYPLKLVSLSPSNPYLPATCYLCGLAYSGYFIYIESSARYQWFEANLGK